MFRPRPYNRSVPNCIIFVYFLFGQAYRFTVVIKPV